MGEVNTECNSVSGLQEADDEVVFVKDEDVLAAARRILADNAEAFEDLAQ